MDSALPSTDRIRLDFQVLVYRENDFWIAHCLETDLVAEGKTRVEAVRYLVDITDAQVKVAIEEGDLKSIFSPAPPDLWRMYATAADSDQPPIKRKKPVNRVAVRELALA